MIMVGIICPADFIKRQPFGGASGLIENIMVNLGLPCTVFGIGINGTEPWQAIELFPNVTFIPVADFSYPARVPLRFSTLIAYIRARRRILRSGVNLLYIHSPEVALPFLFFNRHIPVVFHQHGSGNPITRAKFVWARLGILEKIFDGMLRLIHRRSDWTIAIDDECYAQAEKNGIAHKTTLLMNAVDTDKFAPDMIAREALRKQYGILDDTCVALFSGRLEEIKRVDRVLEAIKILSDRSVNVRLFVAGDGTLKSQLESQVVSNGLSDKVNFLGSVPHHTLPGYYNMADVLVLTSEMEGTPMVILEALATGTPVVAPNVGGIPALINNLSNGVILDEVNPQIVADAIQRVKGMHLDREYVSHSVSHLNTETFIRNLRIMFQQILVQRK
jgi:glycosyltransferase involved in cell wall biosynthesis